MPGQPKPGYQQGTGHQGTERQSQCNAEALPIHQQLAQRQPGIAQLQADKKQQQHQGPGRQLFRHGHVRQQVVAGKQPGNNRHQRFQASQKKPAVSGADTALDPLDGHWLPAVEHPEPKHVGDEKHQHQCQYLSRHATQLRRQALHLAKPQAQQQQDEVNQSFHRVMDHRHGPAVFQGDGKTQEQGSKNEQGSSQHGVLEKKRGYQVRGLNWSGSASGVACSPWGAPIVRARRWAVTDQTA